MVKKSDRRFRWRVLAVVNEFFNWLREFSSQPSFYGIIFAAALLDSVIPIVPSETMVIIGGVSAGASGGGDLSLPLVILSGAAGAFCGDNLAYLIGRLASDRIHKRYDRTAKGRKRLQWAHDQIEQRGGLLLITGRFIPGGRTVLTISCGTTEQVHSWFAKWIALASLIWATYASTLGYFGGKAFEDNHTLAFVVAFLSAISITVLIEIARYMKHRKL